jgi:hypothetical protein
MHLPSLGPFQGVTCCQASNCIAANLAVLSCVHLHSQVALGFARLKHRHHHTSFLEALVARGKHLLLGYKHHQHHNGATNDSNNRSSSSRMRQSANGEAYGVLDQQQQQQQQQWEPEDLHHTLQQQHMCECLATDLAWSIAALDETHLSKEIEQLIRASGIKQESSIHTKNARRLWTVHAWLSKHKGHGLQRLLTEQQLAFCAAASRHMNVLTPPPEVQAALSGSLK